MIPKILGITDEITACDHCGRSDLKRTVVLQFTDDIRHYGTTCAQRSLFPYMSNSQITTLAHRREQITPVPRERP